MRLDTTPDLYDDVAAQLQRAGLRCHRDMAKGIVASFLYGVVLTPLETYVVGAHVKRLVHPHDRVEALYPRPRQ